MGEILNLARMLIRCDVMNEPVPEEKLCGLTMQELRQRSHRPQDFYGQTHFMPEYTDGETVLRLNREKNITVVLITHHMDEAAQAQRVIVLHKGAIAADGNPREVFSQVELLHSIGLAAPDTVELCYALNQEGFSLPLDALDIENCAQTLYNEVKV